MCICTSVEASGPCPFMTPLTPILVGLLWPFIQPEQNNKKRSREKNFRLFFLFEPPKSTRGVRGSEVYTPKSKHLLCLVIMLLIYS